MLFTFQSQFAFNSDALRVRLNETRYTDDDGLSIGLNFTSYSTEN